MDGCYHEFITYQILYLIFSEETIELRKLLIKLGKELKHENFQFALKVNQLFLLKNYHSLFLELKKGPKLSEQLFELFGDKLRLKYFKQITKSFRPNISLAYLEKELAFKSKPDLLNFIITHKCVRDKTDFLSLDCKSSYQNL